MANKNVGRAGKRRYWEYPSYIKRQVAARKERLENLHEHDCPTCKETGLPYVIWGCTEKRCKKKKTTRICPYHRREKKVALFHAKKNKLKELGFQDKIDFSQPFTNQYVGVIHPFALAELKTLIYGDPQSDGYAVYSNGTEEPIYVGTSNGDEV